MDVKSIFGKNLKYYRKAKHLSQEQLSEKVDISVKHLSSIERGLNFVSSDLFEKLAKALNIEPYKLFYDETAVKSSEETARLKAIKTDFLENVSHDFDTAIEKIKITSAPPH